MIFADKSFVTKIETKYINIQRIVTIILTEKKK